MLWQLEKQLRNSDLTDPCQLVNQKPAMYIPDKISLGRLFAMAHLDGWMASNEIKPDTRGKLHSLKRAPQANQI